MKKMKVALVHDYIKEYGGAERVLEALHEIYPGATVFTSVYLPKFLGPHKERFDDWKIKTTWLQHVPFNHKLISPFRLVAASAFRQFDLSEYDVVIVSATGAYFPNAVKTKTGQTRQKGQKEGAVQICYCHTPPRYLYGYATAREWKKHTLFAVLAGIANHFLRMIDFQTSRNVDYYIANSKEVASRIKKFYRREATVIYPPVEFEKQEARIPLGVQVKKQGKKNYYLTGGRLARAKHVGLILEVCGELGVPLKIFGRGFAGYEEVLKKEVRNRKQEARIEFIGEVSDAEKRELMAGAKAFLFASEDEDFGIVPVEAMAAGIPVIAYKSGGVKETIVDGKTGVFFDELTVASLKRSIRKFEKLKIDPKLCRQQAEKFSKERFMREIKRFVDDTIKK